MKNLVEIMAAYNYFLAENIPAQWGDCRKPAHHIAIPDLFETYGYETGIFYQCLKDTNSVGTVSYYIETSGSFIKSKNSSVVARFSLHKGMYSFHPAYFLTRKYEPMSIDMKYRAQIKMPNSIGTFTAKKVAAWMDYCDALIVSLDNTFNAWKAENDKIQERIDTLLGRMPLATVHVWESGDTKHTDVHVSVFKIRFKHVKSQNYLNTEIDFTGTVESIVTIVDLLYSQK